MKYGKLGQPGESGKLRGILKDGKLFGHTFLIYEKSETRKEKEMGINKNLIIQFSAM